MKVQVKKNNTQSAQSARFAQSAVCSLHGLRFNMTGKKVPRKITDKVYGISKASVWRNLSTGTAPQIF